MGAEDNGLTLEGLAQRLETLESENAALRDEVSALRGSGTTTADDEEPESEWSGADGQVSRKWLLSRAGAAALGAVAAGTLLNARTARAHDLDPGIYPDYVITHNIDADNHKNSAAAIRGSATTGLAEVGALHFENLGSGPGVKGIANATSGIGVEGIAKGSNGFGVQGTGRYGVWGESNQAGFYGVTGRNTNTDGTGVRGVGALKGVKGESTDGIGVHGDGPNGVYGTSSKTGYGAVYGKHTGSDGNGVVGDGTGGSAGILGRNSGGIGVRGESSSSSLGAIEGHNDGLGSGVVGVGRVGMLGFSHTDGWPAVWGRHTGNWAGISGDSAKGVGVYGESSSEGAQGVFGRAKGTSQGVAGEALNGTGVLGGGKTGVHGVSSTEGNIAVHGEHTGQGYGVIGDGAGTTYAGVFGRNSSGSAIRGEGQNGVYGKATAGGYGGIFQGGKAQLRIVPGASAGAPSSGNHIIGEIYMDSKGTLFICVVNSTSTSAAKWKKVSETLV